MASVPSTQASVLEKRLLGINSEYALRRELVDNSQATRTLDGQYSVDLAKARTTNEIELNVLKQEVQRDVAHLEAGTKLEIAMLEGGQQVALSTLAAELGLERAATIGEATVEGKTEIAQQKAQMKETLAGYEGDFKRDVATLEGEFKVVLAGIEADGEHKMSEVRVSGIRAVGELDALYVNEEAVVKLEIINQKRLIDETLQRLSDGTQIDGIRVSGQTDDMITVNNAKLDALFITRDAATDIMLQGQELAGDLAIIEGEALININGVSAKRAEEIRYISQQTALEGSQTLNLANQEASYKAQSNLIRVQSIADGLATDVSDTQYDALAKINHINAMKQIRMANAAAESSVDLYALDAESDLKLKGARAVLETKLISGEKITAAKAVRIVAREALKAANETEAVVMENAANLVAAGEQASTIAKNAQLRVGELQTMSLSDYTQAILQAKKRAQYTKANAEADSSTAIADAAMEVEAAKQANEIVNSYEWDTHTFKDIADQAVAQAHKITTTHSYNNKYTVDSAMGNSSNSGSLPIWNILPPKLLEAPK